MMNLTKAVAARNYKIVQMGPHHYLITVPSIWVTVNKIKKGDVLRVEISSDGSLVIKTKEEAQATQEQDKVNCPLDDLDDHVQMHLREKHGFGGGEE